VVRGGAVLPQAANAVARNNIRAGAVNARKRCGLPRNASRFRALVTRGDARIRLADWLSYGFAGGDGNRADSRKELSARKQSGAETANVALFAPRGEPPAVADGALYLHLRVSSKSRPEVEG
jgi:hypothetical protein